MEFTHVHKLNTTSWMYIFQVIIAKLLVQRKLIHRILSITYPFIDKMFVFSSHQTFFAQCLFVFCRVNVWCAWIAAYSWRAKLNMCVCLITWSHSRYLYLSLSCLSGWLSGRGLAASGTNAVCNMQIFNSTEASLRSLVTSQTGGKQACTYFPSDEKRWPSNIWVIDECLAVSDSTTCWPILPASVWADVTT